MTGELEGEHVLSGQFLVDRRRALDKLMRFQLPQAEMFMLPWIRCAIAGGATRVRLQAVHEAFELRFDGRPFDRKELQDPYSCLFDKHRPENRRNRELAIGLLSVLRLKPHFVSLTSGSGPQRVRLRVESAESDRVDASEDPSDETVIKVVPGDSTPTLWSDDAAEWVERLCRASPVPILLSGREAVRSPDDETFGLSFASDDKSVRGWVTVPNELAPMSQLQAYTLGVFVAPTQAQLPRLQAEGWINDDNFTLSASQTGVARNQRFRKSLELAAKAAETLAMRLAEEQTARLESVAAALRFGDLVYYWRNRLERGASAEKPSPLEGAKESVKGALKFLAGADLKKRNEDIAAVQWAARVTAWLREGAVRLLANPEADQTNPLLAALWNAPIQLGASGRPLSLMDLELQRRRLGYIPVTQHPTQAALPFEAVWVTSAKDVEVLVRRFPDAIRDVSGSLDMLAGTPPPERGAGPVLESAGIPEVLARDRFEGEGVRGEIGLALAPHEKGARLFFVKAGTQQQYFELPSTLRWDAAVEPVMGGPSPDLQRALAAAAVRLYSKVASEYDCWKPGDRTNAIRDHLLDYLLATRAEEPTPANRWIDTVPVFDFVDSWLDYDRLRAAVRAGRPVFVCPDRAAGASFAGKLCLAGKRYTAPFLKALLPGVQLIEVPGRAGVSVMLPEAPRFPCSHPGRCIAERVVDGAPIHLQVGEGAGRKVELPWGAVRVFAPQSAESAAFELGRDYPIAIDCISAVLRTSGTLHDSPASAERRFLLQALRFVLAPWPGVGPARQRQSLIELLELVPFFRQPAGHGWALTQVMHTIASGVGVTYARRPEDANAASADLLLEPEEVEFIEALWPGWHRHLVPIDEALRRRAAQAAAPAPFASPAPAPAPATDPEVEYVPPPHLTFEDTMLFARLYHEKGLAARIGLPAKAGSPTLAVFRNGKPVEWPHPPLYVGAVRIEIGGWKGPGPAPKAAELQNMLHRFYLDLADHWPVADPSTLQYAAAVEQLLELLLLHQVPSFPRDHADEQGERLRRLKLFRTLAGGFSDLSEMAGLVQAAGRLPYAEREFAPVPEDRALCPVLGSSQAKLLASILKTKAELVKPPKLEPPPEPEPEPAEPGVREPEGVARARHILRHLRGRRGLKLRGTTVTVDREDLQPAKPLHVGGSGSWALKPAHPQVRLILESELPPAEQAAYLASLMYTEANRQVENVTDQDDVTFQEALADFVTSPEPESQKAAKSGTSDGEQVS